MANSPISSFFASSALKISEANSGVDKAKSIKVVRLSASLISSAMRHSREDGSTVVDARIIQPTEIVIEVICPDLQSFREVNEIVRDRSRLYNITSKGLVFNGFMCSTSNLSQTPEVMSALPTRLVFKQVQSDGLPPAVVSQSSDASLIARGMTLLSSTASSVANLASGIIGRLNG